MLNDSLKSKLNSIVIKEAAEFNGFHLYFKIDEAQYQFLIGSNQNGYIPINIKHAFNERGRCSLCGKNILPVPIGHQWCKYLNQRKHVLLDTFIDQLHK